MGLDLFVMPLWRYLSGQFEGPVEALLGAHRVGEAKPDDSETAARGRAVGIRKGLEERLGKKLDWPDEGTVALSLQYTYPALQALRAFAAYQDHPFPRNPGSGLPLPFAISETSPEEHPSLLCVYNLEAPTRYPHLIEHSDASGFYLPCDFASPLRCFEFLDGEVEGGGASPEEIREIEDSIRKEQGEEGVAMFRALLGGGDASEKSSGEEIETLRRQTAFALKTPEPPLKAPPGMHAVDWYKAGSSIRLLRELEDLNRQLGMNRDWGDLKAGEGLQTDDDPLGLVKYGWGVLHYVARISVEKRLPIVFDG